MKKRHGQSEGVAQRVPAVGKGKLLGKRSVRAAKEDQATSESAPLAKLDSAHVIALQVYRGSDSRPYM